MPCARSSFNQRSASSRGALVVGRDEDLDAVRLRRRRVRLLERDQEPLDPGAEAERGRRRPADLLDQAVVAAAAADRRLRAVLRADELEGRARVVVEPAHEGRDELVGDAVRVEVAANRGEVLAALVAERLADRGRLREHLPHVRRLGGEVVERAQRIAARLVASLLVEVALAGVEPVAQPLDVGRAAVPVADRVQLEPVLGDAEVPQQRRRRGGSPRRRARGRRSRSPRPTAARTPDSAPSAGRP